MIPSGSWSGQGQGRGAGLLGDDFGGEPRTATFRYFEPPMTTPTETAFLRELDKKLWTAADRLRSSLDAAVYKHAVLGLIYLKYVSERSAPRP